MYTILALQTLHNDCVLLFWSIFKNLFLIEG